MRKIIVLFLSLFFTISLFAQNTLNFGYGLSLLGTGDIYVHNLNLGVSRSLNNNLALEMSFAEVFGKRYYNDMFYDMELTKPLVEQRTSGEILELNFLIAPFGMDKEVVFALGLGPTVAFFRDFGHHSFRLYDQNESYQDGYILVYSYFNSTYVTYEYKDNYLAFGGTAFLEFIYNFSEKWNFSLQLKMQPYWGNIANSAIFKVGYKF